MKIYHRSNKWYILCDDFKKYHLCKMNCENCNIREAKSLITFYEVKNRVSLNHMLLLFREKVVVNV